MKEDLEAIAALAPEWCQYIEEYETWDLGKETIFDLTEALKYWEEDCIVGACQRYVEGRGRRWISSSQPNGIYFLTLVDMDRDHDDPLFRFQAERPSLAAAWVAAVRSLLEAEAA